MCTCRSLRELGWPSTTASLGWGPQPTHPIFATWLPWLGHTVDRVGRLQMRLKNKRIQSPNILWVDRAAGSGNPEQSEKLYPGSFRDCLSTSQRKPQFIQQRIKSWNILSQIWHGQQLTKPFSKFLGGQWISARSGTSENALSCKAMFPNSWSQSQDLLQKSWGCWASDGLHQAAQD